MKKLLLIMALILGGIKALPQGYTGYTKCAEQDSLALVALYNATDGPNWFCNSDTFDVNNIGSDGDYGSGLFTTFPYAGKGKWLVGPVKDWFGVVLDKQQIPGKNEFAWRVTKITPVLGRRANGNNNMKGYLPRELGYLTALEWFRINGNSGITNTEVPDEVYQPTLTELDLENCLVSGVISNGFKKCTNLQLINLRYNYLDSIPTFDFFTSDHLTQYFSGSNIFLYTTQISYSTWEKSVKHFKTFTSKPTIKYQLQKQRPVGREQEILAKPGDNVDLYCYEAGEYGKVTWEKKGLNTYKTGTKYTIANIAAKDTGTYRGILTNDTIQKWQVELAEPYTNIFTKPIHVVFTPATPDVKNISTSYSGNEIYVTFSKLMSVPKENQKSEFVAKSNGSPIEIVSISRTGRLFDTYVLTLKSPILKDDIVILSYNKGSVVCNNGGALNSFSDKSVQNLTRKAPHVIDNAITRKDGSGINISFDFYIDGSSLSASDFEITQSNDPEQHVTSVVLNPGELDNIVSRSIQLVLANPISDNNASITVSYKKGSMTGLYAGAIESFGPLSVKNDISLVQAKTSLLFVDNCTSLKNIYVSGTIASQPFKLFDDGTHGDAVANDHRWTKDIMIPAGDYTWSLFQRTVKMYDTTYNGDVMILTPKEFNDSILSPTLSLTASEVVKSNDTICIISKGDTSFKVCDKSVLIILNMQKYHEQNPSAVILPYLMGINGDWKTGIKMDSVGTNLYSTYLGSYSGNEIIEFNFRNGEFPNGEWENDSPVKRTHTVEGNDTLMLNFGEFSTKVIEESNIKLLVFPNPADNIINIRINGTETYQTRVLNIFGQCILKTQSTGQIDISILRKGTYILEVAGNGIYPQRTQFIKK